MRQDISAVKRNNKKTLRLPPGKELAHKRGFETDPEWIRKICFTGKKST